MSLITIEIKAPELVEAVCTLASAMAIVKNSQNPELNRPVEPATAVPAPAQAPAAPTPEAPTGAVPTSIPTYTIEQIAVAATQLVDAGKREELVQLLKQFGVDALTALHPTQYGAFATKLREMGAKI